VLNVFLFSCFFGGVKCWYSSDIVAYCCCVCCVSLVLPTVDYTAVDMQKAAIKTCKEKHAVGNDRLHCVWVEGGVGNEGNRVTIPDSSIDVVVISETHIAEANIGPEEKAIFSDIVRVLKPGGIFVWGNALPTYVWDQAAEYLPKIGFEPCGELNHTKGAILARDEDKKRVDMYVDYLLGNFPVMKYVPHFGPQCHHVSVCPHRGFCCNDHCCICCMLYVVPVLLVFDICWLTIPIVFLIC
jgi:SAM-dependent methyltransferase